MEVVAALLYSLVNNMFVQHTEQFETITNYNKLKSRFKVAPAKILSAPECPK